MSVHNSRHRQTSARHRVQLHSLLPSMLLLIGVHQASVPSPYELPMPIALFTFDSEQEADWEVVNDGVMGGRSAGFVDVKDGSLRFTGTLVTQGGGFTSVRASRVVDVTGETGLELRVRGGGRQFEIEVDDGIRVYGRNVSRRAAFPTTTEWETVRVPFSALRSTVRGEPVNTPPLNPERVQRMGIYMADGQDGPFRLEVDFIRTYRS